MADHRDDPAVKPKRSKRRRRRPKGPEKTPQQRIESALGELGRAAAQMAQAEGVAPPEGLEVLVAVGPARPETWTHRVAAVEAAVLDQLRALHPLDIIWSDGAVFCFQCRQIDCRHARPHETHMVFAGYSATGKPTWRPFVALCLELRVAGLERLYHKPPGVVAVVQMADALSEDLLPGFAGGLARYSVVGQVAMGLVPADMRRAEERVAVTFQVVERRLPGAPVQLRLNLIGLSAEAVAEAAGEGADRGSAERMRRAIKQARRRLGEIGRRTVLAEARKTGYDLSAASRTVLARLRGDLERAFDPEARRTAHARDRHVDGERPTSEAFGDARKASDDKLFVDTHRHTVVVVGKRNRAHVFTHEGRHVTSIRLRDGELVRKTNRGRWAPLGGEKLAHFRARLQVQ